MPPNSILLLTILWVAWVIEKLQVFAFELWEGEKVQDGFMHRSSDGTVGQDLSSCPNTFSTWLGWASQTVMAIGAFSWWLAFFSLFYMYVLKESKRFYR